MIKAHASAENFLQQDSRPSVVVVTVDFHGNPDSVSYWKNAEGSKKKRCEKAYAAGALVDIWV
jgi:hypothetical protein